MIFFTTFGTIRRASISIPAATPCWIHTATWNWNLKTAVVHSARLFFGLTHEIRDGVKFDAAAEYLQSLTDIDTFRINGNMAITVAMSKRFSLSMATLFRFDNKPLPGKENIDTMTTAALVMNIL